MIIDAGLRFHFRSLVNHRAFFSYIYSQRGLDGREISLAKLYIRKGQ